MTPELGQLALVLALCFSGILSVVPLAGTFFNRPVWSQLARPLCWGQFFFVLLAFFLLTLAFLTNDFSVAYVANHSNTHLPWWYRFSAVWGAHEGSVLLWVLIQSGWAFAVSVFSKSLPEVMRTRILSVLGMVSFGFILFILATSNPFIRFLPYAPPDGADLNPLLQDFGLIIHPPILYMGYVGFSVPFAFIIAALLGRDLPVLWTRWVRPWALVAWLFLTTGIVLGSWWAYYELGWGGWWFWDPVENASFMPWLAGTALLHSLAVTEKRGLFNSWTLLLGISTFALSLLGTFLVRSGVLTSVHAFANDPERGSFILTFLVLVIGVSLLLYAIKAPVLKSQQGFHWLSLETALLLNNLLLCTACLMVLLGTLFPLAVDALGLGVLSVGPPYFNTMFIPLVLLTALLLGAGMLAHWKKTTWTFLFRQWKYMLPVALIFTVFILFLSGTGLHFIAVLSLLSSGWIVSGVVRDIFRRLRNQPSWWIGIKRVHGMTWGMHIAHLGLAMSICGVALTSQLSHEKEVKLTLGSVVHVGGYRFRFDDVREVAGPNYLADQAKVKVWKGSKQIAVMYPDKRRYLVRGNIMTEVAIDPGFTRDLYVALGEHVGGNQWAVRIQVKPFIRWVWLGGLLMALGGGVAAADRRYRKKQQSNT